VIDAPVPVPDDALADLSDEDQVRLIERTDNALSPEDAEHPQPEAG
jgi:hypothetical protein